jgi:2-aminoadipate transaminase
MLARTPHSLVRRRRYLPRYRLKPPLATGHRPEAASLGTLILMTATSTPSAATPSSASSNGPATAETIAFTRGVPDPRVLPGTQLAECFTAVLTGDPVGTLQYGQPGGYVPLRKVLGERYGVSENEIFISNGSLQLMDFVAAHFVRPVAGGPQPIVLVEQPSYDRAILAYRRRGAKVIGIPLEHDGIDVTRLEAQVKRQVPAFLYLIPDFQNPAGITLSLEKRRRVLDLAEQYDFPVIEDVPYRRLRYAGEPVPALREIDHPGAKRVIAMSSYSKLVAPALRVGHVVAPADIVASLARVGEDTYLSPVLPTQAALYEYLRRGLLEPNIEHLKQLYAPRCRAMAEAVRRHLPGVSFAAPEGGFFLSVTLPKELNAVGLLDRAKANGLLLSDGRSFFADPDVPGEDPGADRFIRLPFCAVTETQIEEGMRRLAKTVL